MRGSGPGLAEMLHERRYRSALWSTGGFFLENRQRIRDRAFGEAAYSPGLEPLARHEVHLDRRLEKHLTMLLTLQKQRGKVFDHSVLQNLS
jgi:hypothetical protein